MTLRFRAGSSSCRTSGNSARLTASGSSPSSSSRTGDAPTALRPESSPQAPLAGMASLSSRGSRPSPGLRSDTCVLRRLRFWRCGRRGTRFLRAPDLGFGSSSLAARCRRSSADVHNASGRPAAHWTLCWLIEKLLWFDSKCHDAATSHDDDPSVRPDKTSTFRLGEIGDRQVGVARGTPRSGGAKPSRELLVRPPPAYSCRTTSTEISTAGTAPLFSSQWTVFRSSGQPTPGP